MKRLLTALLLTVAVASGAASQTVGPPPSPAGSVACTGDFCTASAPLSGALGGTGVANTSKTITLGGNLTTSGAFTSTFTMTGATGVTFPTSGTLATTGAANIPLTALATQATNTVVGNATSGSASPTALAVGSCSTASSALIWTTNTGFGCNTSITAAVVPAGALSGTTLVATVINSSLTNTNAVSWHIGGSGPSSDPLDVHVATNENFFVRDLGTGTLQVGNANDAFGAFGTYAMAGPVAFSNIATDAAATDTTACIITTTNIIAKGSGTLGICLGTSSARYKTGIARLAPGLAAILALSPKSFYLDKEHGDPTKQMYGFLAEDVIGVLPALVQKDAQGRPNTADYLGMVPVIVNAVQELAFWLAALVVWNIILTVLVLRRRRSAV